MYLYVLSGCRGCLLVLLLLLVSCSSDSGSVSDASTIDDSPTALLDDQGQFLLSNSERDNVVVTDTGLQYEVLREATGPKPGADDAVTVHYAGVLVDGTEFDSSYARGEPASFVLGRTIPGWVEGVQLMSVGSQYRLVIPPALAYGDRGAGTDIPPGAVLIFEIELLEINSS